ncbi:right-handed parallel beta-helix repeat-containing protein [Formosa sp. PL04]|uniref:right-handed parallel beta-helix repeat-containing protein n=1 Tax=Formosa sp. PL04 TaxID=3081755 RepID=UPI0029815F1C|nr:right-handed parallel beta-helix repeat-containing protein [Formosa sp. PL04]MDW5290131.1 right-handed parallel beta-helix repeat-containing protein [Formosa sp. PL04]
MRTYINLNRLKEFLLFFILLIQFGCQTNHTIEVYVAPDGDDRAEGTLESPLATLPQAIQKVRSLRELGNLNPITIYLREGRHQLNETLVLGINDGNTSEVKKDSLETYGAGESTMPPHLTIAAYLEEKPIISAGVPINNWALVENTVPGLPAESLGKVWVADMPKGIEKFYTLYDEQGRLNRARNSGFFPSKLGDKKTLYFPEGALKNWDNLSDVEINIRPSRAWMINMLPLESVDEANGIAKTAVSATYNMGKLQGWVHNEAKASVWVENIMEALDEPGEWVMNSETRKIYLWPSNPADNGSPKGILAPTTSELIRVEGDIDYDGPKDTPVRGIVFSGLTFAHADRRAWTTDEDRLGWGMQHDWDLFDRSTAMLRFRGAEDCSVIDCNFFDAGGSGIRLDLYSQRNKIENCEFAHLGEAGIILAGYGAGTKDVNHHNDIINNHIHHFSEITWHSPGIWAWQSGHNHIAHNYVHHSGYAAVLITNRVEPDRSLNGEGGRTIRQNEIPQIVKDSTKETYKSWKVREKYNHARHNLFEYNEITHAVQKLSDGNAVYVSGAGTGNIIRYNFIHDNLKHSFPSAIRCDDDQHETLIFGNVLYNNYGFAAGIVSKGVNDIINNVIVAPLTAPKWGYVSFEWVRVKESKVHHNIIISHPDGGNAHGERPIDRTEDGHPLLVETDMDSNLYYHPTNPNWMDAHFIKMRVVGNEKNSLFANPLFIDTENGDFGFQPDSPAIKLGIEQLDVSKMGRMNVESENLNKL